MIARRGLAAARRVLADTTTTRRTVFRPIRDQPPPAPSSFASFGDGAWLVPPIRVDGAEHITIGRGTIILEHLELRVAPGARVSIGPGARLGRFVTITCACSVSIGANVSSSDGASITDSWGPLDRFGAGLASPPPEPVVVEDGAYLGAHSTVGPGVTVGRGSFVGEGAVVMDDVPPHTVVYGNPAAVVRRHEPRAGWQGPRFG